MSFDETESIELYKDYSYIMYILCDKTASFYSKIKNIINIPIVICSTGLSILNTTNFDENMIKNISICLNLLIAVSVAILNLFKITEKEFSFKSHSMNFLKLYNKINTELAKSKTILTKIDIMSIINEYNLLCEYITFHIPSRIRKEIRENYKNYKLPIMVINNNKNRKLSLSYYYNILLRKKKEPKSPTSTLSTHSTTSEQIIINRIPSSSYIDIERLNNNISPIQSIISEFSNNSPIAIIRGPLIVENNSPFIKKPKPNKIKKTNEIINNVPFENINISKSLSINKNEIEYKEYSNNSNIERINKLKNISHTFT